MHEDGGIDAYDVLVEAGHGLPPVVLDVVFELYAHLAIVVNCGQAVIDFGGGENESVLLTMGDKHLEKFVLCHINNCYSNISGNASRISGLDISRSGFFTKSLSAISGWGIIRSCVFMVKAP